MELNKDSKIFDDITLSDIARDVYTNSKTTHEYINTLIKELSSLVDNADNAIAIVPLIKEYLEVSVKNDEHLIKLSIMIQRLITSNKTNDEGGGFGLTDADKALITKELNTLSSAIKPSEIQEQHIKKLEGVINKKASTNKEDLFNEEDE